MTLSLSIRVKIILLFIPLTKNLVPLANSDSFFVYILEPSTGVFYIKIMHSADFLRVEIHSWNANVS